MSQDSIASPALPADRLRAWQACSVAWVAVVLATLLLYHGTASSMVAIWNSSETYAHAFIVLPMVLWLIWRQREALRWLRPAPSLWPALALAAVGMLWVLGELVVVNAATHFALVGMLVLSVPAVFGLTVARAITFPLVFAFFAVPVGEFMLPTLMQWTADFTVAAVRLSGVPVYREGLKFVIPSGSWSVVEACSGVRYLISSVMVGSLFAYLNYRSPLRRWVFIGVSFLVPIVANWLRAYMIVMLGHLSNNQIATGVDHLIYGWLFFGVVIMALFMIGARWAEPDAPVFVPSAADMAAATTARWPVWPLAASVAVALITLAAPRAVIQALDPGEAPSTPLQLALPEAPGGLWRLSADAPSGWAPVFANPSASATQAYVNAAGQIVVAQFDYYHHQRADRKLISATNSVVKVDDLQWNAVSAQRRAVANHDPAQQLTVVESQLLGVETPGSSTRQRLRVWQTYWINGHWTSHDVAAKLWGAWVRLAGQGDDSAALTLSAAEGDTATAEPALADFVKANGAALQARLEAARDGARRAHLDKAPPAK